MTESDPEPIGKLLSQVCHLHHGRVHDLFEGSGLYRGQPRVLFSLSQNDGQTHSELAAARNVRPSTVSKMVQRMEKAGFVVRRPDPDDQRVSRVFLTDHGRAVQDEIHQKFCALEQETVQDLTTEERLLLRRLLMQIRENLLNAADNESST